MFVMRVWLLLYATFACVSATPFTFGLKAGSQECFYILTLDVDSVISYYFTVQQGDDNNLAVDYEIYAPDDKDTPIIKREDESQGEWSFVGEHKGEYAFCFNSKRADKIIDLDIKFQSDFEDKRTNARKNRKNQRFPNGVVPTDELQKSIEDSVDLIERQLNMLEKNMQYYKERNRRNQHTVASTIKRIVGFSLYGILLIIVMGIAQIVILQMFFNESRKHVV